MALPSLTYTARDFNCLEGYVQRERSRRPVVELSDKARWGRAQVVFWGETARYDATVSYVDERDGASPLKVLVNGKEVASWALKPLPLKLRR